MREINTVVQSPDVGAGSMVSPRKSRTIGDIARTSPVAPDDGILFYHLTQFTKAESILELGTCLGISTSYFQLGNPSARIISIEGVPELVKQTRDNFEKLFPHQRRPKILEGTFEKQLSAALQELGKVDLVLVDGDHRFEAVVEAVEKIKPHLNREGMIILHDIHWSRDMERAWHNVQGDEEVSLSVDLYRLGILYYGASLREKQNVSLIPYYLKPWRIGLFASNQS